MMAFAATSSSVRGQGEGREAGGSVGCDSLLLADSTRGLLPAGGCGKRTGLDII